MIRNYYGPPIVPKLSRRTRFFIFLAFFAGLCALVPEIGLFRLTFIPLSACLEIWTAFTIISFTIHIPLFWKRYSVSNALWLSVLYGYASAGLPLYIFMATNYYCADNKTSQQTFGVISAQVGQGKLSPNVVINYKGLDKQLFYPWDAPVTKYKSVSLSIKKGYWGFDIVYQQDINTGLSEQ
ncbi:hypothetical protein [Mucilaginibacter sp. R-33]|uniref:hypothetical protein n=1 Tax=Mucilaginibacter sp. R-33 TaxID=3416711 RepID=UPI003CEDFFD5